MMRAAFGWIDITPQNPVPLAGYSARTGPFTQVASRLEANAAVFEDGEGRRALIVAIDCLFVGVGFQRVIEDCAKRHGIAVGDIMVFASHTHFAPQSDERRHALGHFDAPTFAAAAERINSMLESVLEQQSRAICARTASGELDAAIHRRRYWPWPRVGRSGWRGGAILLAPNPAGKIDKVASVVIISGTGGEPLCALWRWTCHATNYPDRMAVSADFPGIVRDRVRVALGAAVPCLYLPGFAGDVRARIPEDRPLLARSIRRAAFGPSFPPMSGPAYAAWTDRIAAHVIALTHDAKGIPIEGRIASAWADVKGTAVLPNELHLPDIAMRRLQLGSMLDVFGIAAEPVSKLANAVTAQGAWACGYLGDVFGYWPTNEQIAEGGYEANDMLPYFNLKGPFAPDTDAVFSSAVRRLEKCR